MEQITNWITDKLGIIIDSIMLLLPDSPFRSLTVAAEVQPVLGFINWALPISGMVAILQAWIVCVSVFYVYQLILRWAKAIE